MAQQEEKKVKEGMVSDLYEKAKAAYELDNFGYSIALFRNLLAIYPDFYRARHLYHMAIIHQQSSQKPSFGDLCSRGVTFFIHVVKGQIYKMMSKPKDAIFELESAFEKFPQAKWLLYESALLAKKCDMEDTAVTLFDELSEFNFKTFDCYKELGLIYLKRKDIIMAKKFLDKAILLDPQDGEILRGMKDLAALGAIEKGFWESDGDFTEKLQDRELTEKLKKVQTIIDKKTTDELKYSTTELDVELKTILKNLEEQPVNNLMFQKIRSLPLSHSKITAFIAEYEKILAQSKPKADAFQFMGDLYSKCEGWEKAAENYTRAYEIQKDPNLFIQIKESELRSIQKMIQPLEKGPVKDELEIKQNELKMKIIEQKISLRPNDTELYYDMGQLYLKQGRIDEAVSRFQKSLESPKYKTLSLIALGMCFFQKNLYELAAEQLFKALERISVMDDQKKLILYTLGDIYIKINNLSEAKSCFKQIYEVDISYKDVSQKMEFLYKQK